MNCDAVFDWLYDFARCVRICDYKRARELFSPNVISFGTVTDVALGIENLEDRQWKNVWPITSNFKFIDPQVKPLGVADYLVISHWHSLDGKAAERLGRATLILAPKDHDLVCIHSHFSLTPK